MLVVAVTGLVFAGIIYEQIGDWRDRKRFPQVGRSYDVGGRSMNLYCSGSGSPTVIFESNGNEPGYRWLQIQRQVATVTRACWYDRAGLGWSDPGPFPNHSDSVAHDLHNLLTAANVPPPYILVGYALGAFHTRVYRSYFPNEVGGLVLVDPMNEDMTLRIHNHNELFRPTAMLVIRMVAGVGLLRFTQANPGPPPQGWSERRVGDTERTESPPASAPCRSKRVALLGERRTGSRRDLLRGFAARRPVSRNPGPGRGPQAGSRSRLEAAPTRASRTSFDEW